MGSEKYSRLWWRPQSSYHWWTIGRLLERKYIGSLPVGKRPDFPSGHRPKWGVLPDRVQVKLAEAEKMGLAFQDKAGVKTIAELRQLPSEDSQT